MRSRRCFDVAAKDRHELLCRALAQPALLGFFKKLSFRFLQTPSGRENSGDRQERSLIK
jgi:hypothetical protein